MTTRKAKMKAARVGGLEFGLSASSGELSAARIQDVFAVFVYWFSRFQLMRSPSVVDEEDELELVWFFDFVSL